MNESLRALVGPPSALRPNSVPDAPPAPAPVSSPPPSAPPVSSSGSAPGSNPPLTRDEVIDLAETVARAHGYDLNSYQRSGTEYHEPDDTWSLTYEKPADTASERGKHFSVTVDNRTKKAAVVPGD